MQIAVKVRDGSRRLAAALLLLAGSLSTASGGLAMAGDGAACSLDRAIGTTIAPRPFQANAYGARWNAATDRIAFIQPDASAHYRIFTIRPDGSDRRPLVPGRPGHQGGVYWSPSGRYILFTAEKPEWSGRTLFGIPDYGALPGFGRHDDLWVARADGGAAWRLTDDPDTPDQGVLVPVFSPTGKEIAWSARQPGGKYVIRLARFVAEPAPHLEDIRSLQPGGAAYYEIGSFSSDGRSLIYTSDQDTHSFWRSQIYRLDLATGRGVRLTQGNDYNEHPTVVATPTGDWIVYMSTRGVDRFPMNLMPGTDWYAMRADGGGVKRLTTMNLDRPDNPEGTGRMQVAGTVAVSPSGAFMLGDVQNSLIKQTGSIKTVYFRCPG